MLKVEAKILDYRRQVLLPEVSIVLQIKSTKGD